MSIPSSARYERALFIAGYVAALALGIVGWAAAADLRIGGSGGPAASLKPVAEVFHKRHPDIRPILVSGLGTRGGIRAAADSSIDIALTSRALTPEEAAGGLVQIEFARTPFVFATSLKNQATRITVRELTQIYAGKTETWPDGTRLRLILRPAADSDTLVLRAISDELRRASIDAEKRPGMVMAITDADSADSIEKIPGAIGTTTLAQILVEARALRALALDGVEPSVKNAMAGTYPLHKRFYLVARQRPSAAAQQFIAFVASAQAQAILAQYGHWVEAPEQRGQAGSAPAR